MQPISRPRGFSPTKYSVDNCLPQLLHAARPLSSEESGSRMVITSPYAVMQPIGSNNHGATYHAHTPTHVTMHMHQQAVDGMYHPHTIRQAFPPSCTSSVPSLPHPHHQMMMPGVNQQVHSHGQSNAQVYTPNARKPFAAKIGAAGRRIADAVKQVGHHGKGHSTSRHSSAGSSKSIVS